MQLASLYAAQGKTQDVEATYRQAAAIAPQDPRPSLALGDFYAAAPDRQSRGSVSARHHLAPHAPEPRLQLAEMYLRQNKLAEAAQYADELRHTPNGDIAGRSMQGRLALARQQPAEANIFQEVIKRQPTRPSALLPGPGAPAEWQSPVGSQRLDRGHAAGASVCRTTWRWPHCISKLANSPWSSRQPRKCCRSNRTIPRRSYFWAEPTWATEKAKALITFRTATDHAPGSCRVLLSGLGYRAQKQEGQALQAFEKALSLNPNLIDALAQVVEVYMTRKEPAKALARVRTQLHTAPQDPLLYNLLGSIYLAQRQDTEAESAFKKAIALNENVLVSYFNLAGLLRQEQSVCPGGAAIRDGAQNPP